MPNYQLQWEMIRWALETGSEVYDFRGVSGDLTPENPLYGLYLFKKGFGGELVEFCGEFEMVYNKAADFIVNKGLGAARSVRHKLHELRHRDEGKQASPGRGGPGCRHPGARERSQGRNMTPAGKKEIPANTHRGEGQA